MSRRNISNRSIGAKKESLILSIYLSEAAGSLACVRLLKDNFSAPQACSLGKSIASDPQSGCIFYNQDSY